MYVVGGGGGGTGHGWEPGEHGRPTGQQAAVDGNGHSPFTNAIRTQMTITTATAPESTSPTRTRFLWSVLEAGCIPYPVTRLHEWGYRVTVRPRGLDELAEDPLA